MKTRALPLGKSSCQPCVHVARVAARRTFISLLSIFSFLCTRTMTLFFLLAIKLFFLRFVHPGCIWFVLFIKLMIGKLHISRTRRLAANRGRMHRGSYETKATRLCDPRALVSRKLRVQNDRRECRGVCDRPDRSQLRLGVQHLRTCADSGDQFFPRTF